MFNTIIIIIIALLIIYALSKYIYTEHMASDGGALIQLNAKGPMDQYLIPNAGDKWFYPFDFNVRPKRSYRFYPYYYPYYYPDIDRTFL